MHILRFYSRITTAPKAIQPIELIKNNKLKNIKKQKSPISARYIRFYVLQNNNYLAKNTEEETVKSFAYILVNIEINRQLTIFPVVHR